MTTIQPSCLIGISQVPTQQPNHLHQCFFIALQIGDAERQQGKRLSPTVGPSPLALHRPAKAIGRIQTWKFPQTGRS